MDGLYRMRLQWDRIYKELKLGRPKKDIHKSLKSEELYPFSYSNFIKCLNKELSRIDNLQTPSFYENKRPKDGFIVVGKGDRDINAEEKQKEEIRKQIKDEFFPKGK